MRQEGAKASEVPLTTLRGLVLQTKAFHQPGSLEKNNRETHESFCTKIPNNKSKLEKILHCGGGCTSINISVCGGSKPVAMTKRLAACFINATRLG